MNPTIDSLLRLHEFDLALDALRRERDSLAPKRDKVEDDRRRLVTGLEDSKKALAQSQLDRKKLEGEIEAEDQSARKHTAELNAVKSNDAYKALLSEIEEAKVKKRAIEDGLLELMERQEGLQKEYKEREAAFAAARSIVDKEAAALEAESGRLEGLLAEKNAEREAFFRGLPEDVCGPYESIRRGRPSFSVLSEVKGMICGGCRTTLTPDVVNQVMKGKGLVSCESCSRILFIRPVPAAPPAA